MTFEETLARLFDRRILLCDEIVNDQSTGRLRVGFINLNLLDGARPIRFYIDVRMGDVDEALRLASTMDTIEAPIVGLVDGRCDTLGLALLQSCDIRLATRFASFAPQRIWSSSSFRYSGTSIRERCAALCSHLELMQRKLDGVIVGKRKDAGLRSLYLQEGYDEQKTFCGEEAFALGFVDQIIEESGFWTGEQVLIPSKIGFH